MRSGRILTIAHTIVSCSLWPTTSLNIIAILFRLNDIYWDTLDFDTYLHQFSLVTFCELWLLNGMSGLWRNSIPSKTFKRVMSHGARSFLGHADTSNVYLPFSWSVYNTLCTQLQESRFSVSSYWHSSIISYFSIFVRAPTGSGLDRLSNLLLSSSGKLSREISDGTGQQRWQQQRRRRRRWLRWEVVIVAMLPYTQSYFRRFDSFQNMKTE